MRPVARSVFQVCELLSVSNDLKRGCAVQSILLRHCFLRRKRLDEDVKDRRQPDSQPACIYVVQHNGIFREYRARLSERHRDSSSRHYSGDSLHTPSSPDRVRRIGSRLLESDRANRRPLLAAKRELGMRDARAGISAGKNTHQGWKSWVDILIRQACGSVTSHQSIAITHQARPASTAA